MSFEKLSAARERAVINSIQRIIEKSRSNPDTDLHKVAVDVFAETDFTPQLIRRACEAYNKSKSTYMLQKRSSRTRGDSFPLIDPVVVLERMFQPKQAAEALKIPTVDFASQLDFSDAGLQKVAAESIAQLPVDEKKIERELVRAEERLAYSIRKLADESRIHRLQADEAIQKAVGTMRKLSGKQLEKVAHLVINRFHEDGERLVKLIGARLERDLPLTKTAAAAILPLQEPYVSLDAAIQHARQYRHCRDLLRRISSESGLAKTAAWFGDLVSQTSGGLRGSMYGLSHGAGKILDPIAAFAKTPVYDSLTERAKKDDPEDVLDPALQNELKQIEATQMFVDIASDDFIKDYPIEDITKAFNNVVSSLPELQEPRYQAWLKTLVRQQLIQGNVYDPVSIEQMAKLRESLVKADMTKLRQQVDAAMLQEAGEGPEGMSDSVAAKLLFTEPKRERPKFEAPKAVKGAKTDDKPDDKPDDKSGTTERLEYDAQGQLLKRTINRPVPI